MNEWMNITETSMTLIGWLIEWLIDRLIDWLTYYVFNIRSYDRFAQFYQVSVDLVTLFIKHMQGRI